MIEKSQIEDKLKKAGVKYEFIHLPENLPPDVASHVNYHGITMKEAVPTLIYRTEKGLIAVQRRADTKFNKQKLQEFVGVKELAFANPDDLKTIGTDVGIVPLTGLSIPYFVDKKVLEQQEIYGGSGTKTYALKMYARDLVKVNDAKIGDFTDRDTTTKKRILTGDTPTGKLHLGHYVGTLENRVKLQDDYDEFIVLADLHAFSTLSLKFNLIRQHTMDVLLDNISMGLDPEKVTFFVESEIPEIYELAAIFSMYVSHNRALRNPTIKDEITMKGLGDQFSLGFVNYPIYQTADILCVKGELVPVGIDQEAHLEQSREIARTLNKLANKTLFPEPRALIGRIGKLVGTDGNPKMSKSLGNTIFLSATAEEVEKKVMNMYTDPQRIHATDPGRVDGNPVFMYLDAFGKEEHDTQISEYKEAYLVGKVGDVEVKKYLVKVLNNFLEPVRERRKKYDDKTLLNDILQKGTAKARREVQKTLADVKKGLKLDYF